MGMEYVGALLVGMLCIVLGISNMRGNISSLHWYHRHRVSEENRTKFGKEVGLGTVIIGIGIVLLGILSAAAVYTAQQLYSVIGAVIMILCLVVGLVMSFRAMIKYNKGIF